MSAFRVYFYDEAGSELREHPLNGKTWLATPGSLFHKGEFNHLYKDSVTVADYADLHTVKNEKVVTIDDFPGKEKVGVKVWYGPERSEKFWLVASDYLERRTS